MHIPQLIEGTFLEEKSGRFLCLVEILGEVCECYVPCSSKLTKHLNLRNKPILLTPNKDSRLRTKYSLFAVKEQKNLIFLNLNLLNRIVEEGIRNKQSFPDCVLESYVERTICGYKADVGFFNNMTKEKRIVEVKGIISTEDEAFHPTVHSERSIKQLAKLKQILLEGHIVHYIFIALSPTISVISIDPKHSEYCNLLSDCIGLGMLIGGYSLKFISGELTLDQNIPVKFSRIVKEYTIG